MKYLYYTLHLFYVKVFRSHKEFPPIINITGVIAFLITSLLFSVVNAYEYNEMGHGYPTYDVLIPISIYLALYKILYDYYKKRETILLEEMDKKKLWIKIIAVVISTCFIILVVKLWMFDGMSDLYQFVKQQFFTKANDM